MQRGPVRPAEVVSSSTASSSSSNSSSGRPPGPAQPERWDEEDLKESQDFLVMQSAISKTYRRKLLEFRRSVTPDQLDGVRASLPPEHWPELDRVWREAQALVGP